jgi:hypothetical protein
VLRKLNRPTPRDLMRWTLGALLFALMISVAPEYWAADRLPRELQYVRAILIVVPFVLSILLYRSRHESRLRQFPLLVALTTTMMFETVLKIGLTGRVAVLLIVWAAVVWVEWRRLVDEARRFA